MKVLRLKIQRSATSFQKDETGAVTVDWVVLTAALVGIGLTILSTIKSGIDDAATDILQQLTSAYDG